jgi:uncharacterized membrane protein YkoI
MNRFVPVIAVGALALTQTLAARTPSNQAGAPATAKAVASKPAEGKSTLADLPPPVRATVEAETRHAMLKGVSKEKENGKTVYELESLVDGRTRDLMIDAAGHVYLVEEQLDIDKAPPAVRAAMEARGRITKLESVTEQGKTHYDLHVRSNTGKTVVLELDADGKALKK